MSDTSRCHCNDSELDHNLSASRLAGTLEVKCGASGLTASVSFLPERQVKGTVSRLHGKGSVAVGDISGFWDSTIEVEVPEWKAQGVAYKKALQIAFGSVAGGMKSRQFMYLRKCFQLAYDGIRS